MKVNYDGDIFHVTAEMPEIMFHMKTDNIAEFKGAFLSEISEAFDNAANEQDLTKIYPYKANFATDNKNPYKEVNIIEKNKFYDLETVVGNGSLKYISFNKNNMQRTKYKKYNHVKLVNINGIVEGQVHFITDEGSYLMLPWCYIISMVPCEE